MMRILNAIYLLTLLSSCIQHRRAVEGDAPLPSSNQTPNAGRTPDLLQHDGFMSLDEIVKVQSAILAKSADQNLLEAGSDYSHYQKFMAPLTSPAGARLNAEVRDTDFGEGGTARIEDIRKNDSKVKDQGEQAKSLAFALVATMENKAKHLYGKDFDLSEEHVHSFANTGSLRTLMQSASETYAAEEWVWKNGTAQPNADVLAARGQVKLTKFSAVEVNLLSQIADVLADDSPVFLWLRLNPSFFRNVRGVIDARVDALDSMHAVSVVGIVMDHRVKAGGFFVFKNSWSDNWGDHGYGYLPFDYCVKYACYAAKVDGVDLRGDDDQTKSLRAELEKHLNKSYVELALSAINDALTRCHLTLRSIKNQADAPSWEIQSELDAISDESAWVKSIEVTFDRRNELAESVRKLFLNVPDDHCGIKPGAN